MTTPPIPGSLSLARHAIGRAKGAIADGQGSACASCGDSPFGEGRPTSDVCGPNFTDYDLLLDASLPMVCDGCARMLGGKPSKTDPPLRMAHFAVFSTGIVYPDGAQLAEILRDPPDDLAAIAWTASRQKHASLRAGLCGDGVLYVGTEGETVEWVPERDRDLLDAVSALRAHARREQVLAGDYPPHVIVALGDSWEPNEAIVTRHRPSTRLDMVCAIVRRPEVIPETNAMPIAEPQRRAAELLLLIASSSRDRDQDPIRFWGETLPRRLAAASSRPDLLTAVGRLMADTHVQATFPGAVEAVGTVEAMEPGEAAEILNIWRAQGPIVLALTRIIRDERREERTHA